MFFPARCKVALVLVGALALSGCEKMKAGVTPAADRITKAFPVSDEVAVAVAGFLETAAGNGNPAASKDRIDKMMQVRALACTATIPIGRFDTPDDIRRKPVDADCMKRQEADIGQWVGLQRIAAALAKPPLVPLAELGAARTLPSYEDSTVGIVTSAQSNVALLDGSRGSLTAIRLPDGKALQTFRGFTFNRNAISLSPNGRVMIAQVEGARAIKAYDIESGALLWSSDKYRELVTWLPETAALVLVKGAPDSGTVVLDLASGKSTPYAAAIRNPSWAVALPGASERRLIGGDSGVSLMEHVREADGGIVASQMQFWRPARQASSGRPFLMSKGTKLVYVSHPGLGWLDLGSGESGHLDMSPLRAGNYAQISDNAILFSVPASGSAYIGEGRVLDFEQMTVAPVLKYEHNSGLILPLSPRVGYMRRGNVSSVGTAVEVGEATDLQQAISAANLEIQLAKIRQAQIKQDAAPQTAMLTNVPPNAQVDVIGVYESKMGVHGVGIPRSPGPVRVTVTPSSKPLVLVLSSYEPVRWMVDNPGGRKISAVLLASYHDSTVFGVGGAQVLKIGGGYAYKLDSPEYRELKTSISRYVSNPISTFQGAYSGQSFMVTAF